MSSWTDERVEKLKELWSDGLSCTQVARALGGTTRNAVIGKVHRLGIDRKAPSGPKPRSVPGHAPRMAQKSAEAKSIPESVSEPTPVPAKPTDLITLDKLGNDTCRYPDKMRDGEHLFCGAAPKEGSPYCSAHHAITHVKPYTRAEMDARRAAKAQASVERQAA
jgi:hypothetical protein